MARKKGTPGVATVPDPQEDAFLRAILENLDDDTPRLVYADWLQDRGNPWGEFIRAQVLAVQKKTPAAQKKKHKARANELMAQHQWLPPMLRHERTKVERGFVGTFGMTCGDEIDPDDYPALDAALAPHASDPFFALTPADVSHHADEENPTFSIPVRVPRIGCLGKIDWEGRNLGCLGESDSDSEESPLGAIFLGSPHLAGLRELRLAACGLKNGAIEALAKNPAVSSLRVLNIGSDHAMEVSGNYFDDKAVKALANSPNLPELEELDIGDAWVGDAGLQALCKSPHLAKLKKLNLYGISLTNKGYQTLARSPFAARLEELFIGKGYYQSGGVPDGVGARALAESPYLDNIQKLTIRLYDLRPEVVTALRTRFGERVEVEG